MKYLNLSACIDQNPALMGATLEQIAAWLLLQCHCHRQMNGGKVINAKGWPEKFWAQLGLTLALIHAESPLWHWTGPASNCLVVHLYDVKAEEAYRKKQRDGLKFAEYRWKKRKGKNGSPIGSPNGSGMGHPMRKEGRKEGQTTLPLQPNVSPTPKNERAQPNP